MMSHIKEKGGSSLVVHHIRELEQPSSVRHQYGFSVYNTIKQNQNRQQKTKYAKKVILKLFINFSNRLRGIVL